MIAKFNNISLAIGIPGFILQTVGAGIRVAGVLDFWFLVYLLGTILLLAGLAYYAKAKGRSPAWCLFAFLSFIGLIVLFCLKDKAAETQKNTLPANKAPEATR